MYLTFLVFLILLLINFKQASFQDDAPYTILFDASVSFLNNHLECRVSERNFRPNIFVTGCEAFAEVSFTWF